MLQREKPNKPSIESGKKGLFPLIGWLDTFLFKHIPNKANHNTQVQKSLELRSIIDCSRHDVSGEGWLILGVSPVLVPTMLSEGSAAGMRVTSSDHRVADIHLRGHLIARFTSVEQSKDISLWFTGHIS